MKLRNKTKSPKRLWIHGKIVVVPPKGIIEGEKIVYDSRSFEIFRPVEKKNSSTRIPRKKTKTIRRK